MKKTILSIAVICIILISFLFSNYNQIFAGCATSWNGSQIVYNFSVFVAEGARPYVTNNEMTSAASTAAWELQNTYQGTPSIPAVYDETVNIAYNISNIYDVSSQEMTNNNLSNYVDTTYELTQWENYVCAEADYVRVVIVNSGYFIAAMALLNNCSDGYRCGFISNSYSIKTPGIWHHEHGHTVGLQHGVFECFYNIMTDQSQYHGLMEQQADAFYTAGNPDGCPIGFSGTTPNVGCPRP